MANTNYIEAVIDGEVVKFAIDKSEISGELPVSGAVSRVENLLPEVKKTIHAIGQIMLQGVNTLHEKPTEICAEFGINIKVGAGVLVANSSMEAQIKITLTWKHTDERSDD